ncbi:MAG: VCBS repeat-containing protein [Planctomycetes bacterium]|nr:VCBS repeat-containing protein [Planctomycetota bacterium]
MQRIPTPVLVLATVSLLPAFGSAQEECALLPGLELRAGASFVELVALDIDLDGDLDLVGAEFSPTVPRLGVLANAGGRRFLAAEFVPALAGATDVASGDMDGDGAADLIVAVGSGGASGVLVWKSSSTGLVPMNSFAIAGNPQALALDDLDHDGDLDVFVADGQQMLVLGLANDGLGNLSTTASIYTGASTVFVACGDLDGDGWSDLSIARGAFQTSVYRYTNLGSWAFGFGFDNLLGGGVHGIEVADLDGDGKAERVVIQGDSQTPRLTVAFRPGQTTTLLPLDTERLATSLRLADVDQDGDLDLVHTGGSTATTVGVFTNLGGQFAPAPDIATSDSPRAVCAADFDGDGKTDLAVSCSSGFAARLTVRWGDGMGGLDDPPQVSVYANALHVAAGDVDDDGRVDLVAATPTAIAFARGLGAGAFAGTVDTPSPLAGTLALVDLDGDHDLDLVQGDPYSSNLLVFEFTSGAFAAPQAYPSPSVMEILRPVDLDLDGDQDLVGIDIGTFQVLVFPNTASLVLSAPIALPLTQRVSSADFADFDADGLLDLVVGCRGTNGATQVLRLRNQGGLAFAAPEVIATAFQFSVVAVVAGDFDGDGDADVVWTEESGGTASLHVLANTGAGAFTPGQVLTDGLSGGGLRAVRLDDDGALDLFVQPATGGLALWTNDGTGRFALQGLYRGGPDLRDLALADLDLDRRTDVVLASGRADRLDLLFGTGACATGSVFCSGDGSASACPCGNAGSSGHGCENSLGNGGGLLAARGQALVSHDTLTLDATNLPGSALLIFFQGTAFENAGAGSPLGDGLLCSGGTQIRLASRTASAGARSFGHGVGVDLPVSVRGQLPPAGGTRSYQVWYRNAAAFCTSATFNLTNGVAIPWGS